MDWETDDGLTRLWIYKHIRTELGAQTSYKDETEKSIVNGQHTAPALQQLLAKYIQGFVLCQNCGLPETSACALAPLRPSLEFRSEWLLLSCAGGHTYLRIYVKHALTLLLPGVYTKKNRLQDQGRGDLPEVRRLRGKEHVRHAAQAHHLHPQQVPKKTTQKSVACVACSHYGWMDGWMIG